MTSQNWGKQAESKWKSALSTVAEQGNECKLCLSWALPPDFSAALEPHMGQRVADWSACLLLGLLWPRLSCHRLWPFGSPSHQMWVGVWAATQLLIKKSKTWADLECESVSLLLNMKWWHSAWKITYFWFYRRREQGTLSFKKHLCACVHVCYVWACFEVRGQCYRVGYLLPLWVPGIKSGL